jgi:uncharacterized protein YlxW (UPF0749 family)
LHWLIPVIPSIQKHKWEDGGPEQPSQKHETTTNNNETKQAVKPLLSKCKALNSSIDKKQNKTKQKNLSRRLQTRKMC